jgi:elongation factor Ts
MSKAKEVLLKHNNDYASALKDLQSEQVNTSKFQTRSATEGLIGIFNHPFGFHSSLVELNCETDFVGKAPAFVDLVQGIAKTVALTETGIGNQFIKSVDLDSFGTKSCLMESETQQTVNEAILATIGKLKENIKLRRGFVFNDDGTNLISGAYAHSGGVSLPAGVGRLGSMVVIQSDSKLSNEQREQLTLFSKKLAQHVSGFSPQSIYSEQGIPDDAVLMKQEYLFGGGTVDQVCKSIQEKLKVKIIVVDMKRYECGQGLERKQDNFAQEVMSQLKQ